MSKDELALTFTLLEWRILAIAAVKAKSSSYAHPEHAAVAHGLARRIAAETGKHVVSD